MEEENPDARDIPFCDCNRTNRPHCPLPGQCNTRNVVYRATVSRHDNNDTSTYTGCSVNLKTRVLQHRGAFRTRKPDGKGQTTLSSHIWDLKDQNVPYDIRWSVRGRAPPFNPNTWVCRLCNLEKFYILKEPLGAQLNQRDEFFAHCAHKFPQLLVNFPRANS